jgi:hypothetical protein
MAGGMAQDEGPEFKPQHRKKKKKKKGKQGPKERCVQALCHVQPTAAETTFTLRPAFCPACFQGL